MLLDAFLTWGEISPRNDAPDEADGVYPNERILRISHGDLERGLKNGAYQGFTHFRNGDVVVAKITMCSRTARRQLLMA